MDEGRFQRRRQRLAGCLRLSGRSPHPRISLGGNFNNGIRHAASATRGCLPLEVLGATLRRVPSLSARPRVLFKRIGEAEAPPSRVANRQGWVRSAEVRIVRAGVGKLLRPHPGQAARPEPSSSQDGHSLVPFVHGRSWAWRRRVPQVGRHLRCIDPPTSKDLRRAAYENSCPADSEPTDVAQLPVPIGSITHRHVGFSPHGFVLRAHRTESTLSEQSLPCQDRNRPKRKE